MGISAVQKTESGELAPSLAEFVAIQATFAAGIEFADDGDIPGVGLLPRKWRT